MCCNELDETFTVSHIFLKSLKKKVSSQEAAHSPLSLQVGEPAQVIGDDVVVPAAGTCHDHHPSVVGGLRDGFGRARLAHLKNKADFTSTVTAALGTFKTKLLLS